MKSRKNTDKKCEYEKLINGMNDTAWLINLDGEIIGVNDSAVELLGYSREEFKELTVCDIDKRASQDEVSSLIDKLPTEKKQLFESVHISKEGEEIPVEVSSSLINYDSDLTVLSVARDIRERKKLEEKMRYLSFHDQLTGLYNRHYLKEEMKRLNTVRQHPISIIILDLNNLKLVNDRHGHHKGDKLIKKTAELLKKSCRNEDFAARMGGDEFIILLPQTSKTDAENIAERITESFEEYNFQDEILFSAALGTAVKDNVKISFDKVITEAEESMYINKLEKKKSSGRNILSAVLMRLREKSDETESHLENVRAYCEMIADKMGFSRQNTEKLKVAAFYHDIGKIILPERLFEKKELSQADYQKIKMHSEVGSELLAYSDKFKDAAEAVKHHHECWDSSGYPDGLSGENIPLFSRIIFIADAFDAMTTKRSYKKRKTFEDAVDELKKNAGTQFDPYLVEIFIKALEQKDLAKKLNIK